MSERLAAARAALARGEQLLAAGDAGEALAAARDGIEALGSDYASPRTKDDTPLKLARAERSLAEGNVESAAQSTLRVLEARAELYARKHEL